MLGYRTFSIIEIRHNLLLEKTVSVIHVCEYMHENRNHILGYTQFNQHEKDATVHAQHKAEVCVIHCLNPLFLLCLATCQCLCLPSELKMNKE